MILTLTGHHERRCGQSAFNVRTAQSDGLDGIDALSNDFDVPSHLRNLLLDLHIVFTAADSHQDLRIRLTDFIQGADIVGVAGVKCLRNSQIQAQFLTSISAALQRGITRLIVAIEKCHAGGAQITGDDMLNDIRGNIGGNAHDTKLIGTHRAKVTVVAGRTELDQMGLFVNRSGSHAGRTGIIADHGNHCVITDHLSGGLGALLGIALAVADNKGDLTSIDSAGLVDILAGNFGRGLECLAILSQIAGHRTNQTDSNGFGCGGFGATRRASGITGGFAATGNKTQHHDEHEQQRNDAGKYVFHFRGSFHYQFSVYLTGLPKY